MASKKSSPTIKKENDDSEVVMGSVTYVVSKIDTVISLLNTSEDDVIIRSLDILVKLYQENPENMTYFIQKRLPDKLERTLQNNNVQIIKLSLKLLAEIYSSPELLAQVGMTISLTFIRRIMTLYTHQSTDVVIQEFALCILNEFVKSRGICGYMLSYGLATDVLNVLKVTTDVDVQFSSLNLFYYILDAADIESWLARTDEYSLKMLLCYLKNDYHDIQDLAMRILIKFSEFTKKEVEAKLIEDGIVTEMFIILMNENKQRLHGDAVTIILNRIESEAMCEHFARSPEFVHYLEFMKTCAEEFALLSAKALYFISCCDDLLQILHDFAAEDSLFSLFKFNDPLVHYRVCCTINNMSKHKYISDRLLTEESLNRLIDLCTFTEYPNQLCTAALQTIYDFMRRNVRTMGMMHKLDGIGKIQGLFNEYAAHLELEDIDILLHMLYMFCTTVKYCELLITEDFCRTLVQQFEIREGDIAKMLLSIMNSFACNEKFLKYFTYYGGPKVIVTKIQHVRDDELLRSLILFVHNILISKNVCMEFLKEKLYYLLETLPAKSYRGLPILRRVIDRMYDLFLPLKFHIKNKLDIEDKLDTGFYLITGQWYEEFPFFDKLMQCKLRTEYTVYTIDYSALVKLSQLSRSVSEQIVSNRFSILQSVSDTSQQFKRQRLVSKEPDLPSITEFNEAPQTSFGNDMEDDLLSYYASLPQDFYLSELIRLCGTGIYYSTDTSLCINHKVRVLARHIYEHTCGTFPVDSSEQTVHFYDAHIEALKKKLGTNIVPIGYVRNGTHVERSLLFKAIADKVGVPASLIKGENGFMWNEVPMNLMTQGNLNNRNSALAYGVVDLVEDVGKIMLVGSDEANDYCGIIPVPEFPDFTITPPNSEQDFFF